MSETPVTKDRISVLKKVAYIFDNIPMEVDAPEKETQSRLYLGVPIR